MRSDFPELNILINNAAVMHMYDFLAGADVPERIEEELRTNLLAPMKLTSLLLPLLQQQPSAAIVLVSSGLAYVPVANLAVYCATKAALHSFARSLRRQLRQTAIKVFELLPPTVNTDMTRTLRGPKLAAEQVAKELLSGIERERYELRVGMVKPLRMVSRLAPLLTERMLNKALSN
jgi:short-subunit dehydrogenase involved in D-alanine esterification of teichoic acids